MSDTIGKLTTQWLLDNAARALMAMCGCSFRDFRRPGLLELVMARLTFVFPRRVKHPNRLTGNATSIFECSAEKVSGICGAARDASGWEGSEAKMIGPQTNASSGVSCSGELQPLVKAIGITARKHAALKSGSRRLRQPNQRRESHGGRPGWSSASLLVGMIPASHPCATRWF